MNENVITIKIADDGSDPAPQTESPSSAGSRQAPSQSTGGQAGFTPRTRQSGSSTNTPTADAKPKDDGIPIRTRAAGESSESLLKRVLASQGGARGIANQTGNVAQQAAAGRGMASLAGFAGSAANALKALGPYGIAAAAALGVSVAAIGAFNIAVDAATRRAQELEKYNAQIAAANAKAEVRRLNADIRESQTMGKDYARLVDAQSRSEESMRQAFMPLQMAFVEALAGVQEEIADLMEEARPVLKEFAKLSGAILKGGAKLATIPIKLLIQVLEAVNRWFGLQDANDEPIPDTLIEVKKALDNIMMMRSGLSPEGKEMDANNAKAMPNTFR